MRRLLVTGGAGFIGTNFVYYWAKKYPDDRIVVLDALTYAGTRNNLNRIDGNENFRFVHGDIVEQNLVRSIMIDENVDTIVHFAAESHVDRSIHDPDAFIRTNILGTHSLLKAARSVWLEREDAPSDHRFHHVSTDEVYGTLGPDEPAFTEQSVYAPNSPYAASKAASDHLVRSYHHTFGLQVTTSNCSNNYGPYQFPEKLIPLVIVNALMGKPLPIYGDGSNIRDWLFVEDHCRGIDAVIMRGIVGETYNIGGGEERSNINIVNTICSRIDEIFSTDTSLLQLFPESPAANGKDTKSLIKFVEDRAGHDWRYAIDSSRISSDLDYVVREDFKSGLDRSLQWMLDNRPWWERLMDHGYEAWIVKNYSA